MKPEQKMMREKSSKIPPFEQKEIYEWIEQLDDPWLEEKLSIRLALESAWDTSVSVGMFIRFRRTKPKQAKALVQMFLKGSKDDLWELPWEWSRDLQKEQVAHLQTLLLSELSLMKEELTALSEVFEAEGKIKWDVLEHLLHRRDDVESVFLLIREREDEVVSSVLSAFDQQGFSFLANLPIPSEWKEETLFRRILAWSPEVWWAQVFAEPLVVDGEELTHRFVASVIAPVVKYIPALEISFCEPSVQIAADSGSPFVREEDSYVLLFRPDSGLWRVKMKFPRKVEPEDAVSILPIDTNAAPLISAKRLSFLDWSFDVVMGSVKESVLVKDFYDVWMKKREDTSSFMLSLEMENGDVEEAYLYSCDNELFER